ncbi:exonuclease SbcCD subunit D [Hathewaya histolytica]|uniref:exonuclease SbcCD subunit D n=1 Tax=Hathewaya histolytica TaxID=1498 RepID=UPI003B682481
MKILHTSDWHLGKNLEGFSRLDEQEKFLNDFKILVEEKDIDLVIIAGDIYDNSNPPARAEKMFYKVLKDITKGGKRMVLIIAGNHDNPERLVAANPLAYEQGVIMFDTPKSVVNIGDCGNHKIVNSGQGYVEIEINGERAVIVTIPYPSEKRLNEVLYKSIDEKERQKSYSDKIKDLIDGLSENYRDDTINLLVSHLYVLGGEECDSERNIQLGGSLAVSASIFPKEIQYVALGHLHKPQTMKKASPIIKYAGSPLQYSKSEIGYTKGAYILDVVKGSEPKIEDVYFNNYKPIEVWKCDSIEHAIDMCRKNSERDVWVYMEIKTDRYLGEEDIRAMKALKKDILEIRPIIINQEDLEEDFQGYTEKSFKEMFVDFYKKEREVPPSDEVMDLFLEIALMEEEEGE